MYMCVNTYKQIHIHTYNIYTHACNTYQYIKLLTFRKVQGFTQKNVMPNILNIFLIRKYRS